MALVARAILLATLAVCPRAIHVQKKAVSREVGNSSSDANATLDEAGYQMMVAKRDNGAMAEFARSLISKMGGTIINTQALEGILPFYSGVVASQPYTRLVMELADSTFVDWANATDDVKAVQAEEKKRRFEVLATLSVKYEAPGAVGVLDEAGYHRTAELRSDAQMEIFVRRVIAAHGGKVIRFGDLHGMLPFYSGIVATQSFDRLVSELKRATWIANWTDTDDAMTGATSPLSETGYSEVVGTKDPAEMELFIRRVAAARNATIVDATAMNESVFLWLTAPPPDYESLVKQMTNAEWLTRFKLEEMPIKTATLDDAGFNLVGSLKQNGLMGRFIRQYLKSRGNCQVTDQVAFVQWLPSHGGRQLKADFKDILGELRRAPFVKC